jgi:hypothetical protein
MLSRSCGTFDYALDHRAMAGARRKRRSVASLDDEVDVVCPYCSARQLLVVDPATSGAMVHDCDVCCRPWTVHVARDEDGALAVTIGRD